MNTKIAYTWIFLILLGFITSDYIFNFFILVSMWTGILILGCTVMIKYGWKQNKYLCLYWIFTLIMGVILSGIQLTAIGGKDYGFENTFNFLPFAHISTIWMIILGVNFFITSFFSRIWYFALLGFVMLAAAYPLDLLKLSFPATTYGILLTIILIGYITLSYLTPQDKKILGEEFAEANGFDEELVTQMHKFKCKNCGYTYEGHTKLNYCPRCTAPSDMLEDVG